jgi:signal transduction histidine kinase
VPGTAFRIGGVQRRLSGRLLGLRVEPPERAGRARGWWGRQGGWRDGPGWRAAAYLLLKVPVGFAGLYALASVVVGVGDISYPIWWPLFRNHPPGVRLGSVGAFTSSGLIQINSWPATLGVAANGIGLLLVGPWVARGVNLLDRHLIRRLLGAPRLQQRIHDLEQTRAFAVDDHADLVRRLERNLHDGAQMRLAALALDLGRTREKLGPDGEPVTPTDLARARELVDDAHAGAKAALAELRVLVRGLHPPVLDHGLPDALATLVAQSPVPATLDARLAGRPSPAVETIAYFCAAELLANTAKHARAASVSVRLAEAGPWLRLEVEDDGVGGADAARGSGLAGLDARVRTVDGRLDVLSPPGGPTRVRVELPLRFGGR